MFGIKNVSDNGSHCVTDTDKALIQNLTVSFWTVLEHETNMTLTKEQMLSLMIDLWLISCLCSFFFLTVN